MIGRVLNTPMVGTVQLFLGGAVYSLKNIQYLCEDSRIY